MCGCVVVRSGRNRQRSFVAWGGVIDRALWRLAGLRRSGSGGLLLGGWRGRVRLVWVLLLLLFLLLLVVVLGWTFSGYCGVAPRLAPLWKYKCFGFVGWLGRDLDWFEIRNRMQL